MQIYQDGVMVEKKTKTNIVSIVIGVAFVASAFCGAAALQNETTYSYDALGRLKQTDYDTSKTQKYKYDAAGNRRQVVVSGYDAPGNDAPITILDTPIVNEDGSVTFDPRQNDTDPDGDPLSLTAVGPAANGAAVKVGNQITYTPSSNWNGVESFTYTISDGTNTASGAVDVTVNAVNDAPNAVNNSMTTNEDVVKKSSVLNNDSDPENDTLTITAKTNGSKGIVAITNSGTKVRYTPNANQNGSDSFTYTISDGNATDTATVNVTITPVNDAPVAVNDTYSGVNNTVWTTLNVRGNDSDIDGDSFTVSSTSGGAGEVQIINSSTQVRYRCLSGCGSDDLFTYTINDGSLTDTATVTLFLSNGGGGLPLF
jgi:YD repeat-containing protein